ncbi:MAG: hypothetical protein O7A64_01255 [Alphaproteobacteria bacterium]|nr:hypothetical protein [Alphaproteobacteria bacterium]
MDQVFVAMSFESRFAERYENIIKPAIEAEAISGIRLRAYRVDNSKTGDSILSDIVDGIAHSRLVLADVSVIDEGRYTETPIRNGNVMYEVGVALACRNTSEVLLIRDDSKKFLFDVSTIPHIKVDFSDRDTAIGLLRNAILDRLSESKLVEDARVKIAAQALTQHEIRILKNLAKMEPNQVRDLAQPLLGMLSMPDERGLDGLIRKGCIKSGAINVKSGAVFHALNPFGYALAEVAENILAKFQPDDNTEPNDPIDDQAP